MISGLGLGLETSGLGLKALGLEAFGLGLETPGLVNIPGFFVSRIMGKWLICPWEAVRIDWQLD